MRNQLLGIILIIAGFGAMLWQGMEQAKQQPAQASAATSNVDSPAAQDIHSIVQPTDSALATKDAESTELFQKVEAKPVVVAASAPTPQKESTYTIENKHIRVTFTTLGGAIKHVAFIARDASGELLYPQKLGSDKPYLFNAVSPQPALSLNWRNKENLLTEFAPNYEMLGRKDNLIQFKLTTAEGAEIIRAYKIASANDSEQEPYLIEHQTKFTNQGDSALNLRKIYVNAGSLPPTAGDIYSQYLNFGYYQPFIDDVEFFTTAEFTESSGILGIGAHAARPFIEKPATGEAPMQLAWGAIKNQFFTGVITPQEQASGIYLSAFDMQLEGEQPQLAMTGNLAFDLGELGVNDSRRLDLRYYVGPKEFTRLEALGQKQDEIMQFGWGPFGFMAQILLVAMTAIHSFVVHVAPDWGWGVTIILLTMIVKGGLWPLTAMQVRSSRKMQQISGPMQALREKFKDNPQKMQQETMKLFKENQVNPAAGCLPLLIQIPIFIGLFFMLRTSSELRFAEFLWITDLSVADSVSWLPEIPSFIPWIGGPIHILPFLMGISMHFQMRMMPTPATDNIQIKIMRFMPIFIFFFSYQFPSGLVLYWTAQNLFTIFQTWVTRDKFGPATIPESTQKALETSSKKKGSKKRKSTK